MRSKFTCERPREGEDPLKSVHCAAILDLAKRLLIHQNAHDFNHSENFVMSTIVSPKVRGFICTTAHPTGCKQHIINQINYVKAKEKQTDGPKRVLVIGASTGFGLASRISAAFGSDAATIGVSFERPATGKRTASAGWYNTVAFENAAAEAGLYAKSINGDGFSNDIKQQTIELIQKDWGGEVDLVIYSIAAPRRTDPETGTTYQSTLKPIGDVYTNKSVDVMARKVTEVSIDPANEDDIENTIRVMGGDDWQRWINALLEANCLANAVKTVAYTYIGPAITHRIYREGTIGRAKAHLEATAKELSNTLSSVNGEALISVNKALVTQASAAIPVVPLYISILFKKMKEKGSHEDCIEQMQRLLCERLYSKEGRDNEGRIRMDDWEMEKDIQDAVSAVWDNVSTDNLGSETDIDSYMHCFYRLFGFGLDGVDYDAPVEIDVAIPSIKK